MESGHFLVLVVRNDHCG